MVQHHISSHCYNINHPYYICCMDKMHSNRFSVNSYILGVQNILLCEGLFLSRHYFYQNTLVVVLISSCFSDYTVSQKTIPPNHQ